MAAVVDGGAAVVIVVVIVVVDSVVVCVALAVAAEGDGPQNSYNSIKNSIISNTPLVATSGWSRPRISHDAQAYGV